MASSHVAQALHSPKGCSGQTPKKRPKKSLHKAKFILNYDTQRSEVISCGCRKPTAVHPDRAERTQRAPQ